MKKSEPQFCSDPVHDDGLGTFCFLRDQCGKFFDDKVAFFATSAGGGENKRCERSFFNLENSFIIFSFLLFLVSLKKCVE